MASKKTTSGFVISMFFWSRQVIIHVKIKLIQDGNKGGVQYNGFSSDVIMDRH